jgi:hypothetical protein
MDVGERRASAPQDRRAAVRGVRKANREGLRVSLAAIERRGRLVEDPRDRRDLHGPDAGRNV